LEKAGIEDRREILRSADCAQDLGQRVPRPRFPPFANNAKDGPPTRRKRQDAPQRHGRRRVGNIEIRKIEEIKRKRLRLVRSLSLIDREKRF
jgi:hypothetical protein